MGEREGGEREKKTHWESVSQEGNDTKRRWRDKEIEKGVWGERERERENGWTEQGRERS